MCVSGSFKWFQIKACCIEVSSTIVDGYEVFKKQSESLRQVAENEKSTVSMDIIF